jgi:large subunit ribosomal protein L24
MPGKKVNKKKQAKAVLNTKLRVGDPVMVISGGNEKKGKSKGQTGKILRFSPKKQRAFVEGVNIIKRHKRAMRSDESSGIISKEGSVHISNLMYYRDDIARPVRIKMKNLEDGRKVRGFLHPETKKFEQIDVG